MRYSSSFSFEWGSICLNPNLNKLYLTGNSKYAHIVNLKTQKINTYSQPITYKNAHAGSSVIIDNKYHIIGGGL